MSMGWAPGLLEAGADWDVWLTLTAVLVLCWGLVVAAMAALFGRPTRSPRAAQRRRAAGGTATDRSTVDGAPKGGRRDG